MLFQALTQLQAGMDDATQLVNSIVGGKVIDVEACTKAKTRLETALHGDNVLETGLAARASEDVVAARKLISDLDVSIPMFWLYRSTKRLARTSN